MHKSGRFAISMRDMLFVYDKEEQVLLCPNGSFTLLPTGDELHLHIWVDSGSLELFTEDGLFHVAIAAVLDLSNREVMITACNDVQLRVKIWELEEIYPGSDLKKIAERIGR